MTDVRAAQVIAASERKILEDFGSAKFTWKTRNSMSKSSPEYKILEENGGYFLRGAPRPGQDGNAAYKEIRIDLKKTPALQWRWRAISLPKDGDEGRKGFNDSACAVYVLFQTGLVKRVIKYTWSSSHKSPEWIPGGRNLMFWKTRYRVLRSGPPTGVWQTEEVDLIRDYREAFGGDPPDHAEGIGVMTDADQTKSESVGDYDDFVSLPGPTK